MKATFLIGTGILILSSAFENAPAYWPHSKTSPADEFYENSSGSPVIALLQGAQSEIDLEAYTMNDPAMDQQLRAAIARGVQVNVVEENSPVGATCHPFGGSTSASSQTPDCLRQQALVSFVQQNGGHYVPFSKSLCGKAGSRCYQHGKMAVIDHQTALLSTGNFDTTSFCDVAAGARSCDRDYTMVTSDTAVISSLSTVFSNDLVNEPSDLSDLASSRLTVSPAAMKPLIDFINSAAHTLQVETQYLEDPSMNQAIIAAANRGVQVSVMVASACSFGKPTASVVKKWQSTYSAFDEAGIQTRVFDAKMRVGAMKGYLHAKAIIVDGAHAWLGSVNGSTTSLTDNREYGLFFDEAQLIQQLNSFVQSDFGNSSAETWQDSVVCKND